MPFHSGRNEMSILARMKWNSFHFGQNEMVISFWPKWNAIFLIVLRNMRPGYFNVYIVMFTSYSFSGSFSSSFSSPSSSSFPPSFSIPPLPCYSFVFLRVCSSSLFLSSYPFFSSMPWSGVILGWEWGVIGAYLGWISKIYCLFVVVDLWGDPPPFCKVLNNGLELVWSLKNGKIWDNVSYEEGPQENKQQA